MNMNMISSKFRLVRVILVLVSCANALLHAVPTDLGSTTDRSGSFLPPGVDANTISLLQYLEDGGATSGSGKAPELSSAVGRDSVKLVPLSVFPVPRSLVWRLQGKRDRAYIGRRNGRRQGRTYIGRRKRYLPFDAQWEESAEKNILGHRGGVSGYPVTGDLAEGKWSGLRLVGSEAGSAGMVGGEREEGHPRFVDLKRARSFIGKRENPLEEYAGEVRGRTLIGEGGSTIDRDLLVGVPSDVWKSYDIDEIAKRARSYIGKRRYIEPEDGEEGPEGFVDPLASYMSEEKRGGRAFIGKRNNEEFEEKRARSFIGKRLEVPDKLWEAAFIRKGEMADEDLPSTETEYAENRVKRASPFIGERNSFELENKSKDAVTATGKENDLESKDKRARSFIGKRDDFESEDKRARSFIGKRDGFESKDKRARSFIGKRDDFESEDKRARSFIGKRDDFESEDKRARSFIGKRDNVESEDKRARSFIGKRDGFESEDKRARSFIGKRGGFESEDKRARSFIGKRDNFESEDKRARSFIGKRDDFESEDKRARSFIGKRNGFESEDKRARSFIGKRDNFESEDKRARSFIGKRDDFESEDKRARSFIGKRDNFESEDKRARSFIGKRDDFESEDKRARSFIGKRDDFQSEDKRARSFIGKRDDFESDDNRARSFIGKRSNEQSDHVIGRSSSSTTNKANSDEGLYHGADDGGGGHVQSTDVGLSSSLNGVSAAGAKINSDSHSKIIENHKEAPPLKKLL